MKQSPDCVIFVMGNLYLKVVFILKQGPVWFTVDIWGMKPTHGSVNKLTR